MCDLMSLLNLPVAIVFEPYHALARFLIGIEAWSTDHALQLERLSFWGAYAQQHRHRRASSCIVR